MLEYLFAQDLDADEFRMLPSADQSRLCMRLADHAQNLAEAAPLDQKLIFTDIARQWRRLAGMIGTAP